MIMLKVTKNQGFTLPVEDTFFEKPQGGRVLGLKSNLSSCCVLLVVALG